jgi:hypothetical protein
MKLAWGGGVGISGVAPCGCATRVSQSVARNTYVVLGERPDHE